jgi:putative transposase
MSDTFSQIHIQIVFAVKHRQNLISPDWEQRLYQYIIGIVNEKGQKLLAINGVQDHIHFMIGMRPTCCLADLVREIKKASTKMINDNKFTKGTFHWQEGYGAFSYSKWDVNKICNYITKQKEHHAKNNFKEEYLQLLKDFEIEWKEEYLFNWMDVSNA